MGAAIKFAIPAALMSSVASCALLHPAPPSPPAVIVERPVIVKREPAAEKKPAEAHTSEIKEQIKRVEKQLRDLRDALAAHP